MEHESHLAATPTAAQRAEDLHIIEDEELASFTTKKELSLNGEREPDFSGSFRSRPIGSKRKLESESIILNN
jgi:hypothetical protein